MNRHGIRLETSIHYAYFRYKVLPNSMWKFHIFYLGAKIESQIVQALKFYLKFDILFGCILKLKFEGVKSLKEFLKNS